MVDIRFDDFWQSSLGRPSDAPFRGAFLNFDPITGIQPVSDRPGSVAADAVPDALAPVLFPSGPAQTYALLDAARIPGLPETLETSRLDHICLFRGDSFDQLKQVAPWLVRIEGSGKFTRNLFRASTKSWHLWGKDAGIFLRSPAGLQDVAAHLRRFTKVSDKAGKWVFFRFWDPLVAQIYFGGMADHAERIGQIFRLPTGQPMEMIVQTGPQEAVRMAPSDLLPPDQPRRAISFDAPDLALLTEVSFHALSRQLADWLAQDYPEAFADRSPAQMRAIGAHVVATGRWLGLTMKQDFAFVAQMMMTSGGWFLQDGTLPAMNRLIADTPAPKAEAMVAAYDGMQAQTPQAELLAEWDALSDHLAVLPTDEALMATRMEEIIWRFLPNAAREVPSATASTRARLRELGMRDALIEGKAALLALLFGPRFFEDPFKSWAGLGAEAAVTAAWRLVIE